jgi:hypothetical protein
MKYTLFTALGILVTAEALGQPFPVATEEGNKANLMIDFTLTCRKAVRCPRRSAKHGSQ